MILQKTRTKRHEIVSSEITSQELEIADKYWVRFAQSESFAEEIRDLKNGKPVSRKSRLCNLNVTLEEEILVLVSRINLSPCLSETTKKPYILCPKHKYTKLVIQHVHEEFLHRGQELVLNEIRQKYWVLKARVAVKSIFGNCQTCKNEKSKPKIPIMGQIPKPRLSLEVRPFVNVGLDFFGPLYVNIGRRKEKRWGALFTCLAVRAIHLEIIHSMDTESTIMAIKRMASRRGRPKKIFCDNGTNLKAASKELSDERKSIDGKDITNILSNKGIEFEFIAPAGPHMGGVWERLIGIVKKTIGKVLYGQTLRDETLQTLFATAEYIVNSRPLTRVSLNPDDPEALTPNHFLLRSTQTESDLKVEGCDAASSMRREWKKLQMLTESFWKRWLKEYLPSLAERKKWVKDHKQLAVDDIVVVIDDNTPRYKWKLGRVVATYPGPDNRVRVVDVKTATGEYRRPVAKLCKLEVEQK